jgi:transposase
MANGTEIFVGIDVGQAKLDVHILGSGEEWQVCNDAEGLCQLADNLEQLSPTLIAVKATGDMNG